ncbi:NBS-LRR type disease resistance protein [Melia azedarach]|uniref:NBS-LRR type disease resistance protein n=1 Tax=Melia azedarach TaxID=155640 RepID=A0ACC1Y666_MELAZ|nr:NBS-LRR type disease resistance protein [Melia azedarach]
MEPFRDYLSESARRPRERDLIINGLVPEIMGNLNPFAKLEYLYLEGLAKLRSIHPDALPFPHLKEIEEHWSCAIETLRR